MRNYSIVTLLCAIIALALCAAALADDRGGVPGMPLTGRIVTPEGKPLPHVPVFVMTKGTVTFTNTANHIPSSTIMSDSHTVMTDGQGVYVAQGIHPGDTVIILVNKPGYRYISGGAVNSDFDGYHADDLVVAPPIAMVGGKVVDASGAPVPAATVIAPLSNVEQQATTDPTGHFVLEGLPKGKTDLIVVTKDGVGHATVQAGAIDIVVTLDPVVLPEQSDPSEGETILGNLFRSTADSGSRTRDSVPLELAPYDLNAAVNLASQGNQPSDAVLLGLVTAATLGDIVKDASEARQLVERISDPGEKALAASTYGLALSRAHPDEAAPLLDVAERSAKQSPIEHYGGAERIAAASLAERLGEKNADRQIDDTCKEMIDNVRSSNKRDPAGASDLIEHFLDTYAEIVAPAGIAAVDRVVNRLPNVDPKATQGQSRNMPLARAAAAMAPYNAPEAAKLLSRTLAGGIPPALPVYGTAAVAIVERLVVTDPSGAASIARTVVDQDHKPVALALAAGGQPAADAAQLWRDALAAALTCRNRTGLVGWVCSLAYARDKALGLELFAAGWHALSTQVALPGGQSAFMFYYAQVDPGMARVTIEKEYASALQTRLATDDDSRMLAPAIAMAAIDMNRAIEMANGIAGPSHEFALRKIAEFVMFSPTLKRTIRFDRWMMPDTWMPGTPADR